MSRTAAVDSYVVPKPASVLVFSFGNMAPDNYDDYVPSNPVTAASLGIQEKTKTKTPSKRYENSVRNTSFNGFSTLTILY